MIHQKIQQNIPSLSTENSIVQLSKVQFQIHNEPTFCFPTRKKLFAILLSRNLLVNRSLFFELELEEYLGIKSPNLKPK